MQEMMSKARSACEWSLAFAVIRSEDCKRWPRWSGAESRFITWVPQIIQTSECLHSWSFCYADWFIGMQEMMSKARSACEWSLAFAAIRSEDCKRWPRWSGAESRFISVVADITRNARDDEQGTKCLRMVACIRSNPKYIWEKHDFTRVTEVVESCQMCWISNGMQHKYQWYV